MIFVTVLICVKAWNQLLVHIRARETRPP